LLLRLSHSPTHRERDNESYNPRQFWIFDTSTRLPSTGSGPEFTEGSAGFRFPIVEARETKPNSKCFVHVFFLNPKSAIRVYCLLPPAGCVFSLNQLIRPRSYSVEIIIDRLLGDVLS